MTNKSMISCILKHTQWGKRKKRERKRGRYKSGESYFTRACFQSNFPWNLQFKLNPVEENAFFKKQMKRLTRKEKKLCLLFASLVIWGWPAAFPIRMAYSKMGNPYYQTNLGSLPSRKCKMSLNLFTWFNLLSPRKQVWQWNWSGASVDGLHEWPATEWQTKVPIFTHSVIFAAVVIASEHQRKCLQSFSKSENKTSAGTYEFQLP